MKVLPVRINWSRVFAVVVAAIESQNDHRGGHEKLRDATAVVCRELGIQGPSEQVVQVVESVVQGVFDQRKAGGKVDEKAIAATIEAALAPLKDEIHQLNNEKAKLENDLRITASDLTDARETIRDLQAKLAEAEGAKGKGRKKGGKSDDADAGKGAKADGEPEKAEAES